MRRYFAAIATGLLLFGLTTTAAWSAPLKIVAAENFYGDIAKQVGGKAVRVRSILNSPNQDPHMFEASPSVARGLARADLVIFSGADYDSWARKLIEAGPDAKRRVINVAKLTGHNAGDNPHIWYDPQTMVTLAKTLEHRFERRDPAHKAGFAANLKQFLKSLGALKDRIASLHQRFQGVPVTATEPVFGYMARAIGLTMRNHDFQQAMMNDTDPSASSVVAFEDDLKQHRVAVLIYNNQVSDSMTDRLKAIARKAGVPLVGVSETQPPSEPHYQDWMLAQLNSLAQALVKSQAQ